MCGGDVVGVGSQRKEVGREGGRKRRKEKKGGKIIFGELEPLQNIQEVERMMRITFAIVFT